MCLYFNTPSNKTVNNKKGYFNNLENLNKVQTF